ncbi:MAG TPA: hypothetical protein VHW23_05765 [Kofleriaceae bacterium]|nr:hypothetical protein [Kofleriaceae bacterium]
MSFHYQLVALPLSDLVAVYSSRDDALLARLLTTQDRYVAYLLEAPERHDALVDLLVGGCMRSCSRPHHSGYAVEAICFELGGRLGSLTSRDVDRVEQQLDWSGAPFELFPDVGASWPLPIRDTPDLPLVGVLSTAQSAERGAALAAARYVDDDTIDDGERFLRTEALESAQRMFASAVRAGTEAIVFFH